MKKNKLIEEVQTILVYEARNDNALNAVDKNILTILQIIADYKVPLHKKSGYFPISLRKNKKLKSRSLEEFMADYGVPADYTTITRSINKLCRLKYIDYKRGFWNQEKAYGQLPYIKILCGTISNYFDDSGSIIQSETDTYGDIANTIYRLGDSENGEVFLSPSTIDSCENIANTIYKDQKENNKNKKEMTHDEILAWVESELDGMCCVKTYNECRRRLTMVLSKRRDKFTDDELKNIQNEFQRVDVETTFGMNDIERKSGSTKF